MAKFYLSNIRPSWSIERQESLLDAKAPEWRSGSIYRDVLSAKKRQAHGAEDLKQRSTMLRPTRRSAGESVTVASLAVLDWSVRGLMAVLTALSERGSTLTSLDCGTVVLPNDVAAVETAVIEFENAIRRVGGDARKAGGVVSGERRSAIAKAACEAMRPYWGLPSAEYPTADLLKQFKLSRPTAIAYLGKRGDAQRAHQHSLCRNDEMSDTPTETTANWEPIHTASLVKNSVLLWDGHEYYIGFYAMSHAPYEFKGWTTGWETAGGYDVGFSPISPTHWMPLPKPPQ